MISKKELKKLHSELLDDINTHNLECADHMIMASHIGAVWYCVYKSGSFVFAYIANDTLEKSYFDSLNGVNRFIRSL